MIFEWDNFPLFSYDVHEYKRTNRFLGNLVSTDNKETDKKGLLRQAAQALLGPFIRLLVHNGVTYREFCDLTKEVYFKAGLSVLQAQNRKTTESHLALLTGLHRKDVSVFMKQASESVRPEKKSHQSFCSGVIAEWISNPVYSDEAGLAIALPYAPPETRDGLSFTGLVESVSTDIRPKAVLQEMLRLGLVDEDPLRGIITLKKDAFVPSKSFEDQIGFFNKNVGDHVAAAVSNIESEEPRFFERSAFNTGLSAEDVVILKEFIRSDGMAFLKKIYRQSENLVQKHSNQSEFVEAHRITCGVYFYTENCNLEDRNKDEDL